MSEGSRFRHPSFARPARDAQATRPALIAQMALATILAVFGSAAGATSDGVAELGSVYSPGGWATLHRGPANRKLVEGVSLAGHYAHWSVLEGASVLTAPTMSPDGKTLYVTTGRGEGHANLHAYDLEGRLLFRGPAFEDGSRGVDPCAVLSSVIVDREGDLYIGDCNQLFAFHGDARLKWVSDLPPIREGDWIVSESLAVNALTTAAFTKDGDVFGVTNFGDIVVFDRATGRRLNPDQRLPGHVPEISEVMPMPASVFGEGVLDPRIREWAWQLLVGGAMPSANTPAVDVESGRIFVAATATTAGRGALYGLDLVRTGDTQGDGDDLGVRVEVEIAFATEMGPGSGSSPSLSPARDRVYVSDEEGRFYSVDARKGEVHWEVETRAASAAAAVAANGDIYALQAYGPALIAIDEAGEVLWESDLDSLATQALPKGFFLGEPKAIGNGNPTVLGGRVLVPVVYGYETRLFGRTIPWPVESSLVAVDGATGVGERDVLSLPDDSTGITAVLPDGTILSSLGTAMTSGVTPLARLARLLLPGDLEPLLPTGGLQVSRPLAEHSRRSELLTRLAQRSEDARADDHTRRPADVLEFAGIRDGMRVAELMAGGGWYAEVLAHAVGPSGSVIAQNNGVSHERYSETLTSRMEAAPDLRVESLVAELDSLEFSEGELDAVLLVQFYHDTVWMGVDRAEMNRRIYRALAPGGAFLVVDHAASEGAGTGQVESLHRIEASAVEAEITAAGFVLADRSSLLANARDDRTKNVFDPAIRGRTDRFLLRFEKPSDPQ